MSPRAREPYISDSQHGGKHGGIEEGRPAWHLSHYSCHLWSISQKESSPESDPTLHSPSSLTSQLLLPHLLMLASYSPSYKDTIIWNHWSRWGEKKLCPPLCLHFRVSKRVATIMFMINIQPNNEHCTRQVGKTWYVKNMPPSEMACCVPWEQ